MRSAWIEDQWPARLRRTSLFLLKATAVILLTLCFIAGMAC